LKTSDLQDRFRRYALYERGITAKAVKAIEASLRMLCEHLQTEELSELNTAAIRGFLYNGREEKLWKAKTFRNHRQHLKSFFGWCIREGLMRKNPTDQIESPKLEKPLPRCLTREEAKKILYHIRWIKWRHEIEALRNEAIISTFIFTGLRLQELIDLEVHDVNLESGEIFVREGKGKKDRTIPINRTLNKILNEYLNKRKQIKSGYFFVTEKSNKISRNCLRFNLEKAVEKLNLKKRVTPHIFRHSFASHLVSKKVSLVVVQKLLGHASLKATSVYLHSKQEDLEEAVNRL